MTVYIYGLVDPRDNRVRYIGKSIEPSKRLVSHLTDKTSNPFKAAWIDELKIKGLKPTIKIIDKCEEYSWCARERFWIAEYRKLEPDLLNISDGGVYSDTRHYTPSQPRECVICRGGYKEDSICKSCPVNDAKRDREMLNAISFERELGDIRDREWKSEVWSEYF